MQQGASDNATRGSHFNKHTAVARTGGSHQRCSFPRQPPTQCTHAHTHTRYHTITALRQCFHPFPPHRHRLTGLPVTQPQPTTPPSPRRSCVTWGSVMSSGASPPSHCPTGCDWASGPPHAQGNYHTSFVAKCMGE